MPDHDLILLGATGFTGRLVAEALLSAARTEPTRLAFAGRNAEKLGEVRATLALRFPEAAAIPLLSADTTDPASLATLAASTRVIATTVGPYRRYGTPVVEACVNAGTHCCDLTGEVPWMRTVIDTFQDRAVASGARIVQPCGFDSIPSDLGTFYTQSECLARWGHPAEKITGLLGESRGGMSGGTAESMRELSDQLRHEPDVRRLLVQPYSLNPDPTFRGPDGPDSLAVGWEPHLGKWTAPFFMAPVNTRVVRRGHALMGFPWGEGFRYEERMTLPGGPRGAALAAGIAAGLATTAAMLASPLASVLTNRMPQPGAGPSEEARRKGHWVMRFVAEAGEKWLLTEAGDAHGDPGYDSTARMLSQSALSLVHDPLTVGGGCWTPASALGHFLVERLRKVGLRFEVRTDGT